MNCFFVAGESFIEKSGSPFLLKELPDHLVCALQLSVVIVWSRLPYADGWRLLRRW